MLFMSSAVTAFRHTAETAYTTTATRIAANMLAAMPSLAPAPMKRALP